MTVDPGPVATHLWLGYGGVANIAAGAAAGTETERFTRPEEVAHLLVMLASDRVSKLTGTDVVIDGGMVQTLRACSRSRVKRGQQRPHQQ